MLTSEATLMSLLDLATSFRKPMHQVEGPSLAGTKMLQLCISQGSFGQRLFNGIMNMFDGKLENGVDLGLELLHFFCTIFHF